MKLYVIAGEQSQKIAEHLSCEFEILGYERTLEGAFTDINQSNEIPDTFLIFGSPAVTGFSEGSVNYAKALIANLKNLRFKYPSSSIKVILSDKAGRDIVDSIVHLGIYDIYQTGTITVTQLPEIIRTQKTIADYQENISNIEPQSGMTREEKEVNVSKDEEPSKLKKIFEAKRFFRKKGEDEEQKKVVYVPHPLITVWSPTGNKKAETALNLAAAAANKGFNTVLVEFDLAAPLLDAYYNIPQTGTEECRDEVKGAGIMTLGENLKAEYVPKLLIKARNGVCFLPAGNKLGNIGTPDYTVEQLKGVLQAVYHRDTNKQPSVTIVNAGNSFEFPNTLAALELATKVVIPFFTPQESELVRRQLTELDRLGISPETIELNTHGIKQVCSSKVEVSAEVFGTKMHSDWEKVFERVV